MAKVFNITGTCIPERHYMGDMTGKIDKIMEMISRGHYFTINRPRQYGKTTTMYLLLQRMQQDNRYLVIDISFEGLDSSAYTCSERFISAFFELLAMRLEFLGENQIVDFIEQKRESLTDFGKLSRFLTSLIRLVKKSQRDIVLMIDEVDKSCNNQLFLDFLGMLRTKYLGRNQGKDFSFHSVILAGVHDVKTLKSKLRPGEEQKYNSPWNIAVDFDVDLSLFPHEIEPMLQEYASQKQVTMDTAVMAQKIFYYTSGYPFLVSFLCKIMDEKILPGKPAKSWALKDLETAVQIALKTDNTNSRSLIKNLEDDPELYDFVFGIVLNQNEFSFNTDNPLIDFGVVYGIFREVSGRTRIHNRIYEQRIFNYMASKLETTGKTQFYTVSDSYLDKEKHLDVERVIRKFQEFIKEQYSQKDKDFIERNGRLLFLAFIKPIINGKGFDFKEVQVSEEKRIDVVITFLDRKYIIELKIWRGDAYHREGVLQLCNYLNLQNEKKGFLLIYDLRKETGRAGQIDTIKQSGKEIFAAWI